MMVFSLPAALTRVITLSSTNVICKRLCVMVRSERPPRRSGVGTRGCRAGGGLWSIVGSFRDQRQTVLEQQRFISCACDRCKRPKKDSVDRLIDGVVCVDCGMDVLLPCEEGAENDEAREAYTTRLNGEREDML